MMQKKNFSYTICIFASVLFWLGTNLCDAAPVTDSSTQTVETDPHAPTTEANLAALDLSKKEAAIDSENVHATTVPHAEEGETAKPVETVADAVDNKNEVTHEEEIKPASEVAKKDASQQVTEEELSESFGPKEAEKPALSAEKPQLSVEKPQLPVETPALSSEKPQVKVTEEAKVHPQA